jgi:hypothetical protein
MDMQRLEELAFVIRYPEGSVNVYDPPTNAEVVYPT